MPSKNQKEDYLSIIEAVELYGKQSHKSTWPSHSWCNLPAPKYTIYGPKDKTVNPDIEKQEIVHGILDEINDWVRNGNVTVFVVYKGKRLDWNKLSAFDLLTIISCEGTSDSTSFFPKGKHTIYVDQEQFYKKAKIPSVPKSSNSGRKPKYDVAKYAAILAVLHAENDMSKLSQDKISEQIIEVAQRVWPEEEHPHTTWLEENGVRTFTNFHADIKKKLPAKS